MENGSETMANGSISSAPPLSIFCSGSENRTDYFNDTFTWTFATLLIIISFLAIVGNFMVILVIIRNRAMRDLSRSTNLFLCNLAIADLLTGAFNIPISIHTLIKECWDFPEWLCTLNGILNTMFYCASLHTLMYISIHKYVSIRRVHRNYFVPLKNCISYVMIVASWLWGVTLAVLTTTILSKSIYKSKTMQCGPQYPKFEHRTFLLHGINQFIGIGLPLGIMIFAYVNIFMFIRHNTKTRRRLSAASDRVHDVISCSRPNDKGVVKTLIIVLACFFLCWTPYVCYTNYATFTEDKSKMPYFLNPLVSSIRLTGRPYIYDGIPT